MPEDSPTPRLLTRPPGTSVVLCPSCEHAIDDHITEAGCVQHLEPAICLCLWTPNDIAWIRLYGHLTQPTPPKVIRRKNDGSWSYEGDWG